MTIDRYGERAASAVGLSIAQHQRNTAPSKAELIENAWKSTTNSKCFLEPFAIKSQSMLPL